MVESFFFYLMEKMEQSLIIVIFMFRSEVSTGMEFEMHQ